MKQQCLQARGRCSWNLQLESQQASSPWRRRRRRRQVRIGSMRSWLGQLYGYVLDTGRNGGWRKPIGRYLVDHANLLAFRVSLHPRAVASTGEEHTTLPPTRTESHLRNSSEPDGHVQVPSERRRVGSNRNDARSIITNPWKSLSLVSPLVHPRLAQMSKSAVTACVRSGRQGGDDER